MIQEYTSYMKNVRGFSACTIKAYETDIRAFVKWMQETRPQARWSTITREDIDAYLKYMTEKGLKATTTNRTLSSISSIYKYMQRQGMEIENPCKFESRKKIPATLPTTIPIDRLARAYQKAQGLRKTLLGILATTGIRLQEMLDLKWEDIDFENSTLKIMGKGQKERIVQTDKAILARLEETSKIGAAHGRIFWISQRTARYMIYETLAPYCKCQHLSPHTIRHTYATELAKNGESTTTIAKILGHSHIETSQKYIDMAQVARPKKGISLT